MVAKGYFDDGQASELVGALITIIGVVWSVLEKRRSDARAATAVVKILAVSVGIGAMATGCATTPNDIAMARVASETANAYYTQPVKADFLVLEGDNVEWTIKGCKRVTLSGPIPAKSIYPRDQGTLQTVLSGAGDLAKTAALGVVGYQGVKALKSISTQPATVVTTEKLVPVEGAVP